MKRKIISLSVTAILALSMILTGCKAKNSTKEQETQSVNNLIESALESINNNSEAAKALNCKVDNYTYNEADITCYIALNQDKASISGDGAGFKDGVLTINSAGTYKISGQLNGRIEIDASKDDTVNIVLDGVDISCDSYAPFTVWQADKTIVYLNGDTTNEFSDAAEYTTLSGTTDDDTPTAAVFSKDDIQFCGDGTLIVNASCNDAITGKDDLIFVSGTYKITANDDGLVGKDSVIIENGSFNITSNGDGIKSTNEEDDEKGFVAVEKGDINISANSDGIDASTYCYISGGTLDITTTSDSDVSIKGIKAGKDITIEDGTFVLETEDDSIHSNDTISIENGEFTISSGDDGIHADNALCISDGTIDIKESYEGIESAAVIINGGKITVKSSDDGINAASGSSVEVNEMPDSNMGKENESSPDSNMDKGNESLPDNNTDKGNMISGETVELSTDSTSASQNNGASNNQNMPNDGNMQGGGKMPQGGGMPDNGNMQGGGEMPQPSGMPDNGNMPDGEQMPQGGGMPDDGNIPNDGNMPQGGGMPDDESSGDAVIYITGGDIYVDADGDGIDVNGSILMEGGTVYVDGPQNDGNGFFDYDVTFEVTGGTVIGSGSSGMLQSISDTSSQPAVTAKFNSWYDAGTKVTLKDSDGNEIISYEPAKSFNTIVISTEELKTGETYEVLVDGESYTTVTL